MYGRSTSPPSWDYLSGLVLRRLNQIKCSLYSDLRYSVSRYPGDSHDFLSIDWSMRNVEGRLLLPLPIVQETLALPLLKLEDDWDSWPLGQPE